jgi:hypothetical protein
MTKKERKEKEDQKRNCTKKAMESVQIESKRTNIGSNIKTYNGQKSDIGSLGLSYVS